MAKKITLTQEELQELKLKLEENDIKLFKLSIYSRQAHEFI